MIRGALPFLLLLSACTFHSSPQEKAVISYRTTSFPKTIDDDNFPIVAFTKNKEAVWQLLDRATMRFAQGAIEKSQDDYLIALDAIDYYRKTLVHEDAAKLLIEDSKAPYIPPFYETLLARFMASCACFQNDDPQNAIALLRQAESLESLERELSKSNEYCPLTHYLLAAALEQQGDPSQARLLYERIGLKKEPNKSATVICLVHDGLLPEKKSVIAPLSLVSMQLLEILLAAWDIEPALSSLSGIAIPAFPEDPSPQTPIDLRLDRQTLPCILSYDLFAQAKDDLEKRLPTIATRAAARQLIRRAGVAYAYEKDPLAGHLADFGMLFANLSTTADTRMWHTLPQTIHVYRKELEPGVHTLSCSGGKKTSFKIEAGDLLIVQLFRPHGHETHFQLPKTKEIL